MIKVENVRTYGWEAAIEGMRNPMNSWKKYDSYRNDEGDFVLGPNDLNLARSLTKAGSDHRKFLRQIFISMNITAPLYWWKEFDTYKVGTVANSCSTMHKIHAKPFERTDFSCDRMSGDAIDCLDHVIAVLEKQRSKFVETKDLEYWHNMIQLLPSSYNQMRTCTMNYENALKMYHARKNHKLPEWILLCQAFTTLPNFNSMFLEEAQ